MVVAETAIPPESGISRKVSTEAGRIWAMVRAARPTALAKERYCRLRKRSSAVVASMVRLSSTSPSSRSIRVSTSRACSGTSWLFAQSVVQASGSAARLGRGRIGAGAGITIGRGGCLGLSWIWALTPISEP